MTLMHLAVSIWGAGVCNAQGELHPLEVGRHALRSGKTFKRYAEQAGIDDRTLRTRIYAAEVVESGAGAASPDHWYQLAEIHAAPRWLWPGAGERHD